MKKTVETFWIYLIGWPLNTSTPKRSRRVETREAKVSNVPPPNLVIDIADDL